RAGPGPLDATPGPFAPAGFGTCRPRRGGENHLSRGRGSLAGREAVEDLARAAANRRHVDLDDREVPMTPAPWSLRATCRSLAAGWQAFFHAPCDARVC